MQTLKLRYLETEDTDRFNLLDYAAGIIECLCELIRTREDPNRYLTDEAYEALINTGLTVADALKELKSSLEKEISVPKEVDEKFQRTSEGGRYGNSDQI